MRKRRGPQAHPAGVTQPRAHPSSADRTGEGHTRLPEEPERASTWAVITSSRPWTSASRPWMGETWVCSLPPPSAARPQIQPSAAFPVPGDDPEGRVVGLTWRRSRGRSEWHRPTGRRGVMPTTYRPACCRRPTLMTSPPRPSPPAQSRRDT